MSFVIAFPSESTPGTRMDTGMLVRVNGSVIPCVATNAPGFSRNQVVVLVRINRSAALLKNCPGSQGCNCVSRFATTLPASSTFL